MKIDRQKYELARARACMGQKDLEAAGIPKGTLCRIIGGKDLRPETAGRIANAPGWGAWTRVRIPQLYRCNSVPAPDRVKAGRSGWADKWTFRKFFAV